VRNAWPGVATRRLDDAARRITFGDRLSIVVAVALNGLRPDEIAVELVLERRDGRTGAGARKEYPLAAIVDGGEGGEQRYGIDLAPELCGHLEYRLRAYPYHPALMHRFEMGLMRWV
jgi:starch phosphorylase